MIDEINNKGKWVINISCDMPRCVNAESVFGRTREFCNRTLYARGWRVKRNIRMKTWKHICPTCAEIRRKGLGRYEIKF